MFLVDAKDKPASPLRTKNISLVGSHAREGIIRVKAHGLNDGDCHS
jgi:hypothetical protein